MEVVYFTVAAIVLYIAADWILDRVERWHGARHPHRSLIFFGILASLSLVVFAILRKYYS